MTIFNEICRFLMNISHTFYAHINIKQKTIYPEYTMDVFHAQKKYQMSQKKVKNTEISKFLLYIKFSVDAS